MFPGATAVILAGATGPQIAAIEHAFNEQAHQWKEYENLCNAGKNKSKI